MPSRRYLLAAALTLVTLFMPLWLFANWYRWDMAEFDCVDGYWECRRHLVWPVTLRVGLALAGYALLVLWAVREWKRS